MVLNKKSVFMLILSLKCYVLTAMCMMGHEQISVQLYLVGKLAQISVMFVIFIDEETNTQE